MATSSIDGNIAKSSGRIAYTTTSSTTSDNAMLNVKNRSSRNGGSGSTTIASNIRITTGAPSPRAPTWRNATITCSITIHLW